MKKGFLYLLVFCTLVSQAQIGGTKTFSFLDLPVPARSNALGGATNAIWDKDINLSYSNPALLNPGCSNQLSLNYVNFVADVNYGNVMYARQFKHYGVFSAGLQYFNYGKFEGRDEYDEKTKNFSAADYNLNFAFAKTINKDSTFSLGVGLKTIYSHYDTYYSFANAIDVGLTYHNKNQLAISLVAKNYGKQWKTFSENGPRETLPQNVQLGLSKKVAKAPFRIIVIYDQLLKWDLTYNDPQNQASNIDPFTNKEIVKTKKQLRNEKIKTGLDKFGRHLILGTEILFGKNFTIRVAYNYRRGKELALPDVKKVNGLSLGFGLKVYKFHFDYAYSKYALRGNAHTIGIMVKLNDFSKK